MQPDLRRCCFIVVFDQKENRVRAERGLARVCGACLSRRWTVWVGVEALRDGEVIGVVPSFRTLQNTLRCRACEDQREPHASNETQAQRLTFAQVTAHVQWPFLVDIDCSVGDRERSIDL
jgi:hypothetical protein